MGVAVSRQVSNNILNNSYAIANNYTQTCINSTANTFNLIADQGCTQTVQNVTITDQTTFNVKCLQNNTTKSTLKNTIQTQITNQAIAAAQSLGLPSASVVDQIQGFAETAASTIENSYTQECIGLTSNDINFECSGTGTAQNIGNITIANTTTTYTDCIQKARTDANLDSTLTGIISNTASAKEANTLISFIIIVLIFLGIFAVIFVRTLNGPIGWIIVIVVVIVILSLLVYAGIAFQEKRYPYNNR